MLYNLEVLIAIPRRPWAPGPIDDLDLGNAELFVMEKVKEKARSDSEKERWRGLGVGRRTGVLNWIGILEQAPGWSLGTLISPNIYEGSVCLAKGLSSSPVS